MNLGIGNIREGGDGLALLSFDFTRICSLGFGMVSLNSFLRLRDDLTCMFWAFGLSFADSQSCIGGVISEDGFAIPS